MCSTLCIPVTSCGVFVCVCVFSSCARLSSSLVLETLTVAGATTEAVWSVCLWTDSIATMQEAVTKLNRYVVKIEIEAELEDVCGGEVRAAIVKIASKYYIHGLWCQNTTPVRQVAALV